MKGHEALDASDRADAQEKSAIRQEVLAGLTPALTIIIAGVAAAT